MSTLHSRDIEYSYGATQMRGYFTSPATNEPLGAVVIIHDAWGLTTEAKANADRFAELGYAVFAADVWGERFCPSGEPEIGPLIGGMVGDRTEWLGRVSAAHETLIAQPEADASKTVMLGYCFGGASALEFARIGGAVRAVVSIHGGLDLLSSGWTAPRGPLSVLLCTGAIDPMATREQREALQLALDEHGIDWEVDLYSNTKHAYTSPSADFSPATDVLGYNPLSAQRTWQRTTHFLAEILG